MLRYCLFIVVLWLTVLFDEQVRAQQAGELPWDLERLSEAPPFVWLDPDSTDSARSLSYQSEDYGGVRTEVFAFYASPATLKQSDSVNATDPISKYPGVVLVHGGGGTAFREWAELWAKRGYAAIAMDLAGYRPIPGKNAHDPKNRQRSSNPGPDQSDEEKFGSVDKPENQQWPYHAVANVILAHSLLRSFPEVDKDRTAITGISWGGYLTCITAGVDHRFNAAVPVYGCGFLQQNSAWLNRFEKMNPDQRERWVKLWDPSQYLPKVSMPILFVNGTNDFAYPLDSYMKSFDLVPANKQLCVTVNLPHSHPDGWAPAEIGLFIDHHLHDGPRLLRVGELQITQDVVMVDVDSSTKENPVMAAQLHFTNGKEAINQRSWQTRDAKLESKGDSIRVIADAPPTDATAWFITVKDQRNATISTRTVFSDAKK
jgi:dienelactone hydrolase